MKRTVKHHRSGKDSSRDVDSHHNRKQDNKRARMVEKYGAVTILMEEEIEEYEEDYDRDSEPTT